MIGQHLEEEIVMPSGTRTTIGNLMAAGCYVQLQQVMQIREEQIKLNKIIKNAKKLYIEETEKK